MKRLHQLIILIVTLMFSSTSYASTCVNEIADSVTDYLGAKKYEVRPFQGSTVAGTAFWPAVISSSAGAPALGGAVAGGVTSGVGTSAYLDKKNTLSDDQLHSVRIIADARSYERTDKITPRLASFIKTVKTKAQTNVEDEIIIEALQAINENLSACSDENGDFVRSTKQKLINEVSIYLNL